MSIESLVIVEGQPDNNPKATVSSIDCLNHVSFQCYYFKIIIIKNYFLTVLCADWWKKRVNKHLMIDLLWMTIHLDVNNRSPIILELGLRVRNDVLRDLKLLKQGGQYYWDKLCFLLLILMTILSLQGTRELCRTARVCKLFTIISFWCVWNVRVLQFCVLKNRVTSRVESDVQVFKR